MKKAPHPACLLRGSLVEAVKEAGKIALDESLTQEISVKGQSDFVTAVDLKINNYLKERLQNIDSSINFFSEEQEGKLIDPCWILDPIDGTTNLIYGFNLSSVSLGLYQDGQVIFTKELSYEVNDEIDELWNLLIEKSVICLRFFDKREPFMENGKEAFVSNPHIDRNLRFDGTRDSNNIEIITFASKKMKFIPKKKSRKPKYRASIQDKYKFKYKLSLEDFSHGMISAIIIYKMLIYFIETDNNPDANYIFDNEDARQFYIRRDILRAIASHTCENIYHINVI